MGDHRLRGRVRRHASRLSHHAGSLLSRSGSLARDLDMCFWRGPNQGELPVAGVDVFRVIVVGPGNVAGGPRLGIDRHGE